MQPKTIFNCIFAKTGKVKKLNLLILKSYIGPFVLTFFISLFILVMQFLWKYIDDLVGKGLEWHVVAQLLFYASATFVPLALPLAILLSSLMTFGNFGERYELVAMKSAGISLSTIMRPLIVLSVIISIGAFFFSNNILPISNLKFKSILYDVRQQKLALNIREGIFYNDIEGYVMRVGNKEANGIIRDVIIYDHTARSGNTNVTKAEWGKMIQSADGSFLELTLYNGYNYDEKLDRLNDTKRPFQRTYFAEQYRKFDLSDFRMMRTDENLFRNHYAMLNLKQLELSTDSLRKELAVKNTNFSKATLISLTYHEQLDSLKKADTLINVKERLLALTKSTKEEKTQILDRAISATRNQKNAAEYESNDTREREILIRKHEVEWHLKFTLSFACLVLFFVGAPFGAIIRKGGLGLPLVVAVIFFVIYHVLSMTGKKSVIAGTLDPVLGMWLSSLVLMPLGILFTYKASNDSPLFDIDVWQRTIKRFTGKKK